MSWQQWDISIRAQEAAGYDRWLTADQTITDAELLCRFTQALLSNVDWTNVSRPAAATVLATAKTMLIEYRKIVPNPP